MKAKTVLKNFGSKSCSKNPAVCFLLLTFFLMNTTNGLAASVSLESGSPHPSGGRIVDAQAVSWRESEPSSKMNYRIDNSKNEITFIDDETRSFATFSLAEPFEIPLALGKIRSTQGSVEFVPTREIKTSGRLYILKDPQDPDFREVVERLPQGGFGRLLRYSGKAPAEKRVDLEFRYEDRAHRITIVDREAGKFYRIQFSAKEPDLSSLFPASDGKDSKVKLLATQVAPFKILMPAPEAFQINLPEVHRLVSSFQRISGCALAAHLDSRAPPREAML